MGNRPGHHTPLENAYSIADVQRDVPGAGPRRAGRRVHHHDRRLPPQPVRARYRLPTLAELDAAVPDHPAYISIGFSRAVGDQQRSARRSSRRAEPPVVGRRGRLDRRRAPRPARRRWRCAGTLTFEERKRSVLDAMAYAASLGVTTHLDQGAFQATNTPSRRRGARGQLHDAPAVPGGVRARARASSGCGSTSCTWTPTRRCPRSPSGCATRSRSSATTWCAPAASASSSPAGDFGGRRCAGGGPPGRPGRLARRGALAVGDRLPAPRSRASRRSTQEIPITRPALGRRARARRSPRTTSTGSRRSAAASTSPAGGTSPAPDRGRPAVPDDRRQRHPAGMSSDGMQIAPMNPFIHAYYATTGVNALGDADQRRPADHPAASCSSSTPATTAGSSASTDEDQLGTLEVGRLGDVAVLDRDYFTVPDDAAPAGPLRADRRRRRRRARHREVWYVEPRCCHRTRDAGSGRPSQRRVLLAAALRRCESQVAAADGATTPAGRPASDPIVVGSTLSLTGAFAATGAIHKIAGEQFVERLNADGGLLGRPGAVDGPRRRVRPGQGRARSTSS